VTIGAGASEFPWRRFVLRDAFGAMAWTAVWVGGGVLIGSMGDVVDPRRAACIGLSLHSSKGCPPAPFRLPEDWGEASLPLVPDEPGPNSAATPPPEYGRDAAMPSSSPSTRIATSPEAQYRFNRRFNLNSILVRLLRAACLTIPTLAAAICVAEVGRESATGMTGHDKPEPSVTIDRNPQHEVDEALPGPRQVLRRRCFCGCAAVDVRVILRVNECLLRVGRWRPSADLPPQDHLV
jgi:hypothetical protein